MGAWMHPGEIRNRKVAQTRQLAGTEPGEHRLERCGEFLRAHAWLVRQRRSRTWQCRAEKLEDVLRHDLLVVVDADHVIAVLEYDHAGPRSTDGFHHEVCRTQAGELVLTRMDDERRAADLRC